MFVGGLFFLIGLYLLFRALRRRTPVPLTSNVADGAEGLGEQARLAQEMRAFYTNPAHAPVPRHLAVEMQLESPAAGCTCRTGLE